MDFLVSANGVLVPVEAKLTATPVPARAAQIEKLLDLLGQRKGGGMVVCLAKDRFPLTRRVDAVPLGAF